VSKPGSLNRKGVVRYIQIDISAEIDEVVIVPLSLANVSGEGGTRIFPAVENSCLIRVNHRAARLINAATANIIISSRRFEPCWAHQLILNNFPHVTLAGTPWVGAVFGILAWQTRSSPCSTESVVVQLVLALRNISMVTRLILAI